MNKVLEGYLHEPGGHVLIEPDERLTVLEAGPEFMRMSLTTPGELEGRSLFEILSAREGKGSEVYRATLDSVQRVKDTLEPDKLPILPVSVCHDHKWERRYWQITNMPVVEDGRLKYVVQRVEDYTTSELAFRAVRVQRKVNYILYCFVILAVCAGLWRITLVTNRTHLLATQTRNLTLAKSKSSNQYRQLRRQELKDVCNSGDQLAREVRALIIGGATSSKAFESIYRRLGLPPYKTRLLQAQRQANTLHLVNCSSLK